MKYIKVISSGHRSGVMTIAIAPSFKHTLQNNTSTAGLTRGKTLDFADFSGQGKTLDLIRVNP